MVKIKILQVIGIVYLGILVPIEIYLRMKKSDRKIKELSEKLKTESALVNKLKIQTRTSEENALKNGEIIKCFRCSGEGSIPVTNMIAKTCSFCGGEGVITIKKAGGC